MLARLTNHKSLKDSQGTAKWKKKLDDLFFRNFPFYASILFFQIYITLDVIQILLKSQKVSCWWHEFCYYFDLILDTDIYTDMYTEYFLEMLNNYCASIHCGTAKKRSSWNILVGRLMITGLNYAIFNGLIFAK